MIYVIQTESGNIKSLLIKNYHSNKVGIKLKQSILSVIVLSFVLSDCYSQSSRETQWADSITEVLWNENVINLENAITVCDSAINIYNRHGLHCESISLALTKNQFLRKKGDIDEALQNCVDCQKGFTEDCDSSILITLYSSLASLQFDLQQFEEADSITSLAIDIYKEDWGKPHIFGGVILNKGAANFGLGRFNSAKKYFRYCVNYTRQFNELRLNQDALLNMGVVCAVTEQMDSAQYYFKKALNVARERNESDALSQIYNALAGVSSDSKIRMLYMDSAMAIAKNLGDVNKLSVFSENIAYEYFDRELYRDAFIYLEDHVLYKDSFLSIEKVKALTEIEQKYEAEKRRAEIQELQIKNLDSELNRQKAEKGVNRLLLGISALGLFLFFGIYRFVLVRKNQSELQMKNQEIETERERSDNLLLNILPAEVATELKDKGEAEARDFENVTVLFTDIVNFTRISESMTAKEVVAELDIYFKEFDKIIEKNKIEKIKTIGDSYMAAGGIPDPSICQPENVVKAAIEMRDFVKKRNVQRTNVGYKSFAMRFGIHSGPVVAGIVGLNKFQYDIWGDTVNIASRMESSGSEGKINISKATYDLVKDEASLNFESRGKVEAKDKGEMNMYFVESAG